MLTGRLADINAAVDSVVESHPHWRIEGDRLLLHDDTGNALICEVRSEEQVLRRW
jgi:hypothetical protein